MVFPHIVYWLGAVADWYTTRRGLKKGFKEGNPIPRWVGKKVGLNWAATILKGGLWTILFFTGAPAFLFYLAGVIYLGAGLYNYRLIK